jgi:hypothetical protein
MCFLNIETWKTSCIPARSGGRGNLISQLANLFILPEPHHTFHMEIFKNTLSPTSNSNFHLRTVVNIALLPILCCCHSLLNECHFFLGVLNYLGSQKPSLANITLLKRRLTLLLYTNLISSRYWIQLTFKSNTHAQSMSSNTESTQTVRPNVDKKSY